MAYYIRKPGTAEYFMGYNAPLQPMSGLPEWAFPFPSVRAAYDSTPANLHETMEVVDEAGWRCDWIRIHGNPASWRRVIPLPAEFEDYEEELPV